MAHRWWLIVLTVAAGGTVQAQTPRRVVPMGITHDTLIYVARSDRSRVTTIRRPLGFVAQDTTRQCRPTTPYVLFGAAIGFLVGSARYEKGLDQSGADFAPWLTMPLVIGPYVLGGMLIGHLIAPC